VRGAPRAGGEAEDLLRKGRAASIGLGLASTALSLVAAEVGYRAVLEARHRKEMAYFASVSTIFRLAPGSPLIFRLPPSHDGRVHIPAPERDVPYRTNADGFRDPARAAKRQRVPRVLVLGDSYTFGWGVADHQPYPQRAEALLRERGIDVEVITAGVPGYNTEQEAFLLRELLPRYRPDVVVVGYVMNDAEPQQNVPQPPGLTYRYAWSWAWEDARELVRRRLLHDADWVSPNKWLPDSDYARGFAEGSPRWRESKAALACASADCRRAGLPLIVLILRDFTKAFDASYPDTAIHRAVVGWGKELGIETTDLLPLFEGQDHRSFWVEGDGHPNARAHGVIARALRDRILARLRL
jgi:lysophospholipase L1-like esterase